MKKYLFSIIGLLILCVPRGIIYADECSQSCKISDAPAPALVEYLTNLSSIESNILDALSQASSELSSTVDDSEISQVRSELSRTGGKSKQLLVAFTNLLSFNDHFGNFDYKISLPITNEVPKEVKRDHKKIEKETHRFTQILERSIKRGTSGMKIDDVCSGVSNCSFPANTSASNILTAIIKSNRRITQLYESSILDKAFLAEKRNFILVSDDFESQIETYYNKDTLGSCSKCEGNTWATLGEKTKNISLKNSEYKKGVQTWKDAWTLLRGGKASGNQQAEQAKVLTEYLGSQGISGSQSDVVLDNLEKYGSGGVSGSNPLFNSSSYAQAGIENEVDTFSQTLQERFAGEEKVPIVTLSKVNSKIKASSQLNSEIKSIFEDQLPFTQGQDTETQKLQLRILNMHFSLVRSINMLQKNKRVTEKLCDKQGTGMGKCSYE